MNTDSKIEWNENGLKGFRIEGSKKYTIYSPQYGILEICIEVAKRIINSPNQLEKDAPICDMRFGINPLSLVYPKVDAYTKMKIMSVVSKIGPYVKEGLKGLLMNDKQSDSEFLMALSMKRNWKQGCAICLADKIMGTTCSCGHTEITIFRPCGHSVCSNPCAKDLFKTNETKCHMCGQTIEHSFETQNVRVDNPLVLSICINFMEKYAKELGLST